MAWNGSDSQVGRSVPDRRNRKENGKRVESGLRPASARGPYRGLVAGLIVAALGCGAIWWFAQGTKHEAQGTNDTKHNSRAIAEVMPQIVTNKVETRSPEELRLEKLRNFCTTNKFGRVVRFEEVTVDKNGKRWFMGQPVPDNQPGQVFDDKGKQIGGIEHFKSAGDNFLAATIFGEITGPSAAPSELPPGLLKKIKEHIRDEIEISPEDPPDVVQLKKDMIAVKAELASRMDAGEDLEAILADVRDQNERIVEMREGYEDGLRQLEKDGASDQDIEDYVTAANQLLSEKGAAKLRLPMSVRRKKLQEQLKIRREQKGNR